MPKVKVTIRPEVKLCLKLYCSNYLCKFDETSQKDKKKYLEVVSRTRLRFLCPRSMSQSGQRSKSCFSNNSKTTEANLTKLHRRQNIMRCVAHNS